MLAVTWAVVVFAASPAGVASCSNARVVAPIDGIMRKLVSTSAVVLAARAVRVRGGIGDWMAAASFDRPAFFLFQKYMLAYHAS